MYVCMWVALLGCGCLVYCLALEHARSSGVGPLRAAAKALLWRILIWRWIPGMHFLAPVRTCTDLVGPAHLRDGVLARACAKRCSGSSVACNACRTGSIKGLA